MTPSNLPIDFHAIAPQIVMAATLFLVLLVDLFLPAGKKHRTMPIALLGALASLGASLTLIGDQRTTFGGSFVADNFAVLFDVFFSAVAIVVILLSYRYVRDGRSFQGEYYFLILCSFLGAMSMGASRDLLLLFISLELVSAPAFLLVGFRKKDPRSNEAALKFFLISVLSTAVMLYGISLIYGVTGTTRLSGIASALASPGNTAAHSSLALAAILFTVAGFAFKVSAFPFQFWAPDTYEGAPVPIAAYLSVASKAAGFVGLLQIMFVGFLPKAHFWAPIFALLSLFTMFLGNLVAIQQRQIVRLLSYSSIAQAGYMLLPFALAGYSASVDHSAFSSVVLYILIYAIMNLGAFAVVIGMSRTSPSVQISDFSGLGRRLPAVAVAMTAFMVSLGGIPPTAGFWGKFSIFLAAISRGGIGNWLAVAMVLNSVISLFYYLGIVRAMWLEPSIEPVRPIRMPALVVAVAMVAMIGVFVVGVFPNVLAHFPPFTVLASP